MGHIRGWLRIYIVIVALGLAVVGCQSAATVPSGSPTVATKASTPSPRPSSPVQTAPIPPASGLSPVLQPTPGPTAGPVAGVPGRIIYARDGGFWTIEPGSGKFGELFPSPNRVYFGAPALSPDGKLLAYSVYDLKRATEKRDNGTDLYLAEADGKNERTLFAHDEVGAWVSEAAWSPDGKSIYYTRRDARGAERIERIAPDGSARTTLIEGATTPTISNDGQRLAYLVTDPQTYTQELMVANSTGASPQRLLGDPEFQGLVSPRFAPDGQRLAFIAVGGPDRPVINRTTYTPRISPGWWQPPTATAHGIPYNVWIVNVDGTNLRRLTNDLEVELPVLAWSPDGKWIAVTSDQGLNILEVAGTQMRFLAREFAVGGLDWSAR